MTTDNGNGTRVPDEGEFLHQVHDGLCLMEAFGAGLKASLEDVPYPGKDLDAEEMARAKTAMRRLFTLTDLLRQRVDALLQTVEAELHRREQPPGNT